MLMLENPYEGLWEKHRSVDDMDMILETRMGGTRYGRLSVLSANNDESISATADTTVSRQIGTITE